MFAAVSFLTQQPHPEDVKGTTLIRVLSFFQASKPVPRSLIEISQTRPEKERESVPRIAKWFFPSEDVLYLFMPDYFRKNSICS